MESLNRQLVEWWSCQIVESSNGGLVELSNRRIAERGMVELSNNRIVECWNGEAVESSNGGMVE